MIILFLSIIGCYLAAAALVHLAYWFKHSYLASRKKAGLHYIWIADQSQTDMEWHLRSLFSFSRKNGKQVKLTLVDRGMSDESVAIVERFTKKHGEQDIEVKKLPDIANTKLYNKQGCSADHWLWILQNEGVVNMADSAVLVDLHNPQDLSKLPY